jgi:hypothetical protein
MARALVRGGVSGCGFPSAREVLHVGTDLLFGQAAVEQDPSSVREQEGAVIRGDAVAGSVRGTLVPQGRSRSWLPAAPVATTVRALFTSSPYVSARPRSVSGDVSFVARR